MGLIDEFKEFAVKGNAIDLAVGAIIGASFGKIVTSLTDDLIMPPVGFLVSKVTGGIAKDLTSKFVNLDPTTFNTYKSLAEAKAAGAPVLAIGSFINTALQFLILAFAVFLIVKAINKLRRDPNPAPTAAPAPTTEELLLTEIRDLLAAGRPVNATAVPGSERSITG
jgi:large conductance mechanosensitive channel